MAAVPPGHPPVLPPAGRSSRADYQPLKKVARADYLLQLSGVSGLERLRTQGLMNVMVDMSWWSLIVVMTLYYIVCGGVVGAVLYAQTPEDDVPLDATMAIVLFAYRGFALLCLSPVDESTLSSGTTLTTTVVMIFGSLASIDAMRGAPGEEGHHVRMACVWHAYGMRMACVWHAYGMCMACVWHVYGMHRCSWRTWRRRTPTSCRRCAARRSRRRGRATAR